MDENKNLNLQNDSTISPRNPSEEADTIQGKWHSIVNNILTIRQLLIEGVTTRVKLFSLEVDEFNNFILKKLITLVALSFLGIAFLFSLNIAIIIYFWDTHREEAAWSIVGFLLILIVSLIIYFIKTNKNPPLFHDTLAQLKKDIGSL